ncbi:MFS transporter [Streptomyces sp. NPDC015184]|uniref:MFS transporter n=1 Tax=Streptomyces sp. NPDC015184 TaxID=3364946 RepID=UPI0037021548
MPSTTRTGTPGTPDTSETPGAPRETVLRDVPPTGNGRLPLPALLALATAVFITSLTETLPAGLLPAMSSDLGVGEAAAGQTVTVYAVGTALTAIPLAAATARWSRKRLLLAPMAGFAAANTVTALSSVYLLTMTARFVAGVAAGLAWALLAGYARQLAPPRLEGRAVAVAMTGIPLALSLGVPAGTFLGQAVNWQTVFLIMTGLTLLLLVWIAVLVPDRPGRERSAGTPMRAVLRVPGVLPVLTVTLVFVLAHTILYTYIATLLEDLDLAAATDAVLLVFGAASLLSVWLVGALIHRRPRALMVASALLVAVAVTGLALWAGSTPVVYVAVALWGLGWGGVPTLLQTAAGDAAGDAADAAQAALVTLWNAAMAAGGLLGGLLFDLFGVESFARSALVLLVPVLVVVLAARIHGFPAGRGRAS